MLDPQICTPSCIYSDWIDSFEMDFWPCRTMEVDWPRPNSRQAFTVASSDLSGLGTDKTSDGYAQFISKPAFGFILGV